MTNSEEKICPSMFMCVKGITSESRNRSGDPIPTRSYQWHAEEGAIYYIYIDGAGETPGGEYSLYANTFDDATPTGNAYLRKMN
eukprot:CAMPEP_0201642676 /NCGR_PEP_ID=MMETSP0493-20130528/26753_1 /ASSEMBLY_ACC=CAM_ASM_000838 /TAXON_ID=420259 /ORGANISM="Thalassiosira gravida, Strain GMp14c1" /LENGTH=83 /DNA_ID=CAMNT_0048116921 /DNA_START=1 /DNA_END=252 /DNA_ORIENTATION=+